MFNKLLKLTTGFIFAISAASPAIAGGEAEVLHRWTSGGEAKALQVLKDDFAKKRGTERHACCRWRLRCRYGYS